VLLSGLKTIECGLMTEKVETFVAQLVDVAELKAHPRNYQVHPEYQLKHIQKSIATHGFYRNIVVAKDKTILAGHGVVEAATRMGLKQVPVHIVDLEPNEPKALQILTGDNEINNLAVVNDRMLTELLKEITTNGNLEDLLGTGFDAMQLAALVAVTRPASEILNKQVAMDEWLGMPSYDESPNVLKVIVSFDSPENRAEFFNTLGYQFTDLTKSVWFPHRLREDPSSLRYE